MDKKYSKSESLNNSYENQVINSTTIQKSEGNFVINQYQIDQIQQYPKQSDALKYYRNYNYETSHCKKQLEQETQSNEGNIDILNIVETVTQNDCNFKKKQNITEKLQQQNYQNGNQFMINKEENSLRNPEKPFYSKLRTNSHDKFQLSNNYEIVNLQFGQNFQNEQQNYYRFELKNSKPIYKQLFHSKQEIQSRYFNQNNQSKRQTEVYDTNNKLTMFNQYNSDIQQNSIKLNRSLNYKKIGSIQRQQSNKNASVIKSVNSSKNNKQFENSQKVTNQSFNKASNFKNSKLAQSFVSREIVENLSKSSKSKNEQLLGMLPKNQNRQNQNQVQRYLFYQNSKSNQGENIYQSNQQTDYRMGDTKSGLSMKNTLDSTQTQTRHPNVIVHYPEFIKQENLKDSRQTTKIKKNLLQEYQKDVFEFLKFDLIKLTEENKSLTQKKQFLYSKIQQEKVNNLRHYLTYKQFKKESERQKNHVQMRFLERQKSRIRDQLNFYKQHFSFIETSMILKQSKQQNFYFNQKTKLQQRKTQNNEKIVQLKRQVQNLEIKRKIKQVNSDNFSGIQALTGSNKVLKLKLQKQQHNYNQIYRKYMAISPFIKNLQKNKEIQYKQILNELRLAKKQNQMQ